MEGEKHDFEEREGDNIKDKTKVVNLTEMAVAAGTETRHYLGTTDLASCIGLVIYDTDQKIGGIAHVYYKEDYDLTLYMRDEQQQSQKYARYERNPDDSSDERNLVVDNVVEALINEANKIGGKQYKLIAFNVKRGDRKKEQNRQLEDAIKKTAARLGSSEKINGLEFRNERAFILDTGTGKILPYK